jgi:hypothetical protein
MRAVGKAVVSGMMCEHRVGVALIIAVFSGCACETF